MAETRRPPNLKHGAAAAEKAIEKGLPFTGLALEVEKQVQNDLETQGKTMIMERNCTRAQACCDLYWSAIIQASDNGDLPALEARIARFGWLIGVTSRAWDALDKMDKGSRETLDSLLGKVVNE